MSFQADTAATARCWAGFVAMSIAEIVAIPLTGGITRALSTRGAFVVRVLGFTASSAACAGAAGFWWLDAAIFMALAFPDQCPGRDRGGEGRRLGRFDRPSRGAPFLDRKS